MLLERYGLRPKHSFGQNFLSDPRLLARVADIVTQGLEPGPDVHVLELGAGLGALTGELLGRGYRVTAVERDRDLVPALLELFAAEIAAAQLEVIEGDAKAIDYAQVLGGVKRPVLAGNLPYQITGPLLERAIVSEVSFAQVVFLVQREVADRLVAEPGSEAYGALSVFAQARYRTERALKLGGGAFYPPPRVESALVRLVPHEHRVADETALFRQLVSLAFQARRKTLRNAWKSIRPLEELTGAAERADISLDARGETLSVHAFARMARALGDVQPPQVGPGVGSSGGVS